jgi:hypothetical protein
MGPRGPQGQKLGYQATQNLTTPGAAPLAATGPGQPTSLLGVLFDEPDAWTIEFSIQTPNVLPVPTPSQGAPNAGIVQPEPWIPAVSGGVRAIATVNWKVSGNQIQRIFDIGSGVSITGVSASCDVQIQDLTYSIGGAAGLIYSVACTISRGTRASTGLPGPVLWNGPVPTIGSAVLSSVGVEVPSNAGVVSVEVTAVSGTPLVPNPTDNQILQVTHYNGSQPVKQYVIQTAGPDQIGFIKLAPGTNLVTLENFTGTAPISAYISWGIDG